MIQIDNLFIIFISSLIIAYLVLNYFGKKGILIDDKSYSEHKRLIKTIVISAKLLENIKSNGRRYGK